MIKNIPKLAAVSADYVKNLKIIAQSANISLLKIVQDLGMPAAILHAKAPLSLVDFFRIQERLSIEIHDESLLMSERPLLLGTNDHVLASLVAKETIVDALRQLATSYNFIHGGNYNRVELRERYLVYLIDDANFPYSPQSEAEHIAFTMENILVFVHGIMSTLLNIPIGHFIKKVHFKACRASTNLTQTLFNNVSIQTSSKNYALFYDVSIGNEVLAFNREKSLTSQVVYREIQQLLSVQSQDGIQINCLKSQVIAVLESGIRQQDKVASHLGYSVATLRRNLNQQNSSFRKLKEMVLSKHAKVLLNQHLPLIDIAETLGFSDTRSFIRAFKHWHGITPSHFIKKAMFRP